MGRIKTTIIKRTAKSLFESHKEKFKEDFGYNKKKVAEFAQFHSKKIRNGVAGYVTTLLKQSKQPKKPRRIKPENMDMPERRPRTRRRD